MKAFDPKSLGIEKAEFDSAVIANPSLADQFPEAREYVDSLMAARGEGIGERFEEAKTAPDGFSIAGADLLGVLESTEEPPFVLEFALSRDGEILAISSLASEAPEGIPEWAWQAYLEGLVVRARGRAALRVCEEEGRIAGLFADEYDVWDEADDELEELDAAGPESLEYLGPTDDEEEEEPLF